ncbi:ammonia-forming cytochrome c nitrite reductase [Ferrimonas balearica]|uniref:ammonia-forming cytochrome c nitrite reductase n=1 Tax=Ferrimonas balearica TaxID=44012 RepID=UPI001C564C41|nr:ammonia-forming cytochrome c nitrite reductase [Ferrimonas balearica]MBW3165744.1 ammonia-forming cytochrome c nitrite reductase [Ferrimonas balearica]MBY6107920.1 ammonia-forming cytochrome c nitrite reductase [Ferrimonas balearica]MBY6225262.1 ammonia-forming cytochrome c nitrite reductase [Ferrimonas balearica]
MVSTLRWRVFSVAALMAVSTAAAGAGKITEADSSQFAKFKHQYETWQQTKDSSEVVDALAEDPMLVVLWAGYGFAKDYNKARGHHYTITDLRATLRTGAPKGPDDGPMPMACWSCKSPDVPRYIEANGEDAYFKGKWARGGNEITHEIGCGNCHDNNARLRVSVPFADRAMETIGMPWDKASKSDRQSMVCGQCHVEYYFTPDKKFVKFPWDNGLSADEMEKYYDAIQFSDWTHGLSKAPMLKAQHPGFETWKTGTHGRNDVSCTDCHMPRVTNAEGRKYTDHNVGNPFDQFEFTCARCHEQSKEELEAVTKHYKEMVTEAKLKAEKQLVHAHFEAKAAWDAGATEAEMKEALTAIRHAQWRWDMSIASHGIHAHNPEEALRLLASSLERSSDARASLARVLAKHGQLEPIALPDISTKAAAQVAVGLDEPAMQKAKDEFLETVVPEWDKEYQAKYGSDAQ